jgi:hypothetical protein
LFTKIAVKVVYSEFVARLLEEPEVILKVLTADDACTFQYDLETKCRKV